MEEEEQDETPLEEPLRIREYSEPRQHETCMVCGQEKEPYILIEYENKAEYTCEECYKKSVGEPVTAVLKCAECGGDVEDADDFCGKCGAKQKQNCPDCGERISSKDAFCGKCGAKL